MTEIITSFSFKKFIHSVLTQYLLRLDYLEKKSYCKISCSVLYCIITVKTNYAAQLVYYYK